MLGRVFRLSIHRILGDSFLRTFYTAYNVQEKKVGLALATGRRTDDECEADASISATNPTDASDPSSTDSQPTQHPRAAEDNSPPTPAPQAEGGDDDHGETGDAAVEEGDDAQSEPDDDALAQNGGGVVHESESSDEGGEEGEPSLVAVAAAASLGTLLALGLCGFGGVLVVRRIRRGEHRHSKLGSLEGGDGGVGVEMSGNGRRAGNGVIIGAEDDFLQAGPGGYRGNGSGSHRYRVAADDMHNASFGGGGGGGRVVVAGSGGYRDDEGDNEDEDEVEVDFGVSQVAGGATPMGRLGRMFGRGHQEVPTAGDEQELVGA